MNNNITVERVMNAYEAKVIKPSFEGWGNIDQNCGCALAAVAINERSELFPNLKVLMDTHDNQGTEVICEAVGITFPYMLGFTDGFDGLYLGCSNQEDDNVLKTEQDKADYNKGYEHGVIARTTVIKKYSPESDESIQYDLIPLTKAEALQRFRDNREVYRLYDDGTEGLAEEEEAILDERLGDNDFGRDPHDN